MTRLVSTLASAFALMAALSEAATFSKPTFVGEVGWGMSNGIGFNYTILGYAITTGWTWSRDGGASFINCTTCEMAPNTVASAQQASTTPRTFHSYGDAGRDQKTGSFDNFTSGYSFEYGYDSIRNTVTMTNSTKAVVFQGLPSHVSCHKFSCPFRFGGTAAITFNDGTVLQTAIITWGGNPKSPDATSIVAYTSQDHGYTLDFLSVVSNASAILSSEEGPNEHDMVLLSNGTVFMVVRIDGGDGPLTHPYRNYYRTLSHDQGRTWTPLTEMAGVGSARPRALLLGNGALVLSGGRHKNAGDQGPKVWVDPTGKGLAFDEYDVSYYHNLGDSQLKFTSDVNNTAAGRQTTCYTSLIATSERSFLVGYDVNHYGFIMAVSL